MSTIKTVAFNSNELSEELDDASLQAITGGDLLGLGSLAGTGTQGSSGGAYVGTPLGYGGVYGSQGSSVSGVASGLFSILP